MNLKDRLRSFYGKHNYLPGTLDYLIDQDWVDEPFLKGYVTKAIEDKRKIPIDGAMGGLTLNEQAFLSEFEGTV